MIWTVIVVAYAVVAVVVMRQALRQWRRAIGYPEDMPEAMMAAYFVFVAGLVWPVLCLLWAVARLMMRREVTS